MKPVYNEKQKLAITKIHKFLSSSDKFFYLLGYPGTGKTFLISNIIKGLIKSQKIDQIYVCAPTHQALNVIESNIKSSFSPEDRNILMINICYMTIHKLLECRPVILTENGSKIFQSNKESKYLKPMEDKLIFIDECSMIAEYMVKNLQLNCDLYPMKIVFLGDKEQLNPVNENQSIIFKSIPANYEHQVLLDQIMRTNSIEIKNVCQIIRQWNMKDQLFPLLLPPNNKGTFKVYQKKANIEETQWFKFFINKLTTGDAPIILTWTNNQCNIYNQYIRQYVHNSNNLNNYIAGDLLIFNKYYLSPDNVSFYTSNIIKIIEIESKEKKIFDWTKVILHNPISKSEKLFNSIVNKLDKIKNKFMIDTMIAHRIHNKSDDIDEKCYTILTINRQDIEKYQKMLDDVRECIETFYKKYKADKITARLWNIYYNKLIDPYATINFGYSLTTHKSQGSTFKIVFVDVSDICNNSNKAELKKCLYTAAGRASNILVFIV